MRFAARIPALILLLVLSAVLLSGCNRGPAGVPPLTLDHAKALQAVDPEGALNEYQAISNHYSGSNQELAATALFDLAQYAADPNGYGSGASMHLEPGVPLTAGARKELSDRRASGLQQAQQALTNLQQHFGNTSVVKSPQFTELFNQVNDRLDQENSHLFTYKLIDALVAMTGRKPAFSYWFALLAIAVLIKVVTFPTMLKTYKSQREMQKMAPIIKQIQAKYKDDPQEQMKKVQEAYKEHGVNMFATCLPSLIQLPIFWFMIDLIEVYRLHFTHGTFLWIGSSLAKQYPAYIGANLGSFDMPILVLYALSMMLTMKLTPVSDPAMAQQQKTMSYMMTFFIMYYFIVSRWASAFLVYYLIQNLLSAVQQYYFIYLPSKNSAAVTISSDGAAALARPVSGSAATSPRPVKTTNVSSTVTPVDVPRPRPKKKKR